MVQVGLLCAYHVSNNILSHHTPLLYLIILPGVGVGRLNPHSGSGFVAFGRVVWLRLGTR